VIRLVGTKLHFVNLQEGIYKIWISCTDYVAPWRPPELPSSSIYTPWLHSQTLPMMPITLTIRSNPNAKPRGCGACQGPHIATLPGQWINATELQAECGRDVLGAIHEWFEDDFVWAARECTYPFRSRANFLEHFAGANILFAGDSTVSKDLRTILDNHMPLWNNCIASFAPFLACDDAYIAWFLSLLCCTCHP
jgi:hypothetical protein